jgi:hypothetical protein
MRTPTSRKGILAAVGTLLLLILVSACGGNERVEPAQTTSPSQTTQPAPTEPTRTAEAPTEPTTTTEREPPAPTTAQRLLNSLKGTEVLAVFVEADFLLMLTDVGAVQRG